jgi:hypothetical protein
MRCASGSRYGVESLIMTYVPSSTMLDDGRKRYGCALEEHVGKS